MIPRALITSLICLAILLGGGIFASAQDSIEALFIQGNASYQKGDFASAERDYRKMVEAGVVDGSVFYNLGNACFKQKKLGEAIYYWEKARRLRPFDQDIRENLDLANLLLVDRIDAPQDPLPLRMLNRAVHLLSIRLESWTVLLLFLVANGLFAIYQLAKNPRPALAALMGALVAGFLVSLFAASLAWKIYESGYRRDAVVVEQKVDLRSGPGTDNITVFTVHEGIIVRIRGEAEGWYQVSLPNGWSGWLQQNAIRIL